MRITLCLPIILSVGACTGIPESDLAVSDSAVKSISQLGYSSKDDGCDMGAIHTYRIEPGQVVRTPFEFTSCTVIHKTIIALESKNAARLNNGRNIEYAPDGVCESNMCWYVEDAETEEQVDGSGPIRDALSGRDITYFYGVTGRRLNVVMQASAKARATHVMVSGGGAYTANQE